MHYQPMQPQYPQPAQYAPPPQQYVQQPAQSPQLFFQPQQQPQAWNNSALNQARNRGEKKECLLFSGECCNS